MPQPPAKGKPYWSSGLVLVTDALLAAGFTDSGIRAVMGGNVIRVLQDRLP